MDFMSKKGKTYVIKPSSLYKGKQTKETGTTMDSSHQTDESTDLLVQNKLTPISKETKVIADLSTLSKTPDSSE